MLLGFGARARLYSQDQDKAIYEYAVFDLFYGLTSDAIEDYDGIIVIDKNSLIGPEYHEKRKRNGHGKTKLVKKIILRPPNVEELLEKGLVKVLENRHSHRHMDYGADINAVMLIYGIYEFYQKYEELPENIGFQK